jgi:hypothetical protein
MKPSSLPIWRQLLEGLQREAPTDWFWVRDFMPWYESQSWEVVRRGVDLLVDLGLVEERSTGNNTQPWQIRLTDKGYYT